MGIQLSLNFHIALASLGLPDHFGTINSYMSIVQILKDAVIFLLQCEVKKNINSYILC